MFNLEKSINDWREQMRAAGIKTTVPLEELEIHLREDIDRLVQSGLGQEKAFETATRQLGQPQVLKAEFKKNGAAVGQKLGIVALIMAAFLILNVLYLHGHTGFVWVLFPVIAVTVLSWTANTAFFNFSLGVDRETRLWKIAAMTFSSIAICLSLLPIGEGVMNWHPFSVAFGTAHRLLTMLAVAVNILSLLAWRHSREILPHISNLGTRTLIGIIFCLLCPAAMTMTLYLAGPQLGHVPAPLFFVVWPWTWTATAILAGAGYGLAEAARRRAIATT